MLAKSKLLFVVIFTWHFCGIHTMALAMEEAMEEATNEVKEDRSTEIRDELFSIIGRVVSVHSGDTVQILLPDGELISVRLAGIESPSPDDPLGSKSHHARESKIGLWKPGFQSAELE